MQWTNLPLSSTRLVVFKTVRNFEIVVWCLSREKHPKERLGTKWMAGYYLEQIIEDNYKSMCIIKFFAYKYSWDNAFKACSSSLKITLLVERSEFYGARVWFRIPSNAICVNFIPSMHKQVLRNFMITRLLFYTFIYCSRIGRWNDDKRLCVSELFLAWWMLFNVTIHLVFREITSNKNKHNSLPKEKFISTYIYIQTTSVIQIYSWQQWLRFSNLKKWTSQ